MSNVKIVEEALKSTPAYYRGKLVDFLDAMDSLRRGIQVIEAETSQCFIRGSYNCGCIEEAKERVKRLFLELQI